MNTRTLAEISEKHFERIKNMSLKSEAFSNSINQYLNYTEMPWGKLFYLTAWSQIENYIRENNQTILDIGCGFGISSIEFARRGNKVKGIDPTLEMIEIAKKQASEMKVDIEFSVTDFQGTVDLLEQYNWVFCHNILEYLENPEEFIKSISKIQHQGHFLSLIAHNPAAKVMKKAIINKDPEGALDSVNNYQEYSGIIQTNITTYSLDHLGVMLEESGYEIQGRYGIHNIYGYISDNEIKHDINWHNKTVKLELELGEKSPYRDIAVFTHIIARKKS
ncbi:class I SAM-dependent methyltransferase [Paenibacillus tarimensis]